jgi:hypothetical protein
MKLVWHFGAPLYAESTWRFGTCPTPESKKHPTLNAQHFGAGVAYYWAAILGNRLKTIMSQVFGKHSTLAPAGSCIARLFFFAIINPQHARKNISAARAIAALFFAYACERS